MADIQEWATLKLARGKGATTLNNPCIIDIKSPGQIGTNEGRVINGGQAWFDNPHIDDYIEVYVVDVDGLIPEESRAAFPSYPIIGSFTDMEVDAVSRGFWIPIHKKYIEVKALASMGFISSGFYLRMVGNKGDGSIDIFRTNIEWGKRE